MILRKLVRSFFGRPAPVRVATLVTLGGLLIGTGLVVGLPGTAHRPSAAIHTAIPAKKQTPKQAAATAKTSTPATAAIQTPPRPADTTTTPAQSQPQRRMNNSTALPPAKVTPFPTPAPKPSTSVSPNFAIHVTKTGPKSISWTSDYTATGYYLIFQTQGCTAAGDVVVPCTTYLTAPGTTAGSYTFTYGGTNTYNITSLVDVCVNANTANCGMAADNYAYLNF